MDNIRLVTTLPATPEEVYDAWLSSREHTAMTGGSPATTEARVGGRHTARDGYISGEHIELEPGKRILQTWRTTEFPETAPDSLLEIVFLRDANGTRLTLIQNGIPDGQGETYHEDWQDHYFAPMRAHFELAVAKTGTTKTTRATKAPRKPRPKATTKPKPTPKAKARGKAKPTRASGVAKAGKKRRPATAATKKAKGRRQSPSARVAHAKRGRRRS